MTPEEMETQGPLQRHAGHRGPSSPFKQKPSIRARPGLPEPQPLSPAEPPPCPQPTAGSSVLEPREHPHCPPAAPPWEWNNRPLESAGGQRPPAGNLQAHLRLAAACGRAPAPSTCPEELSAASPPGEARAGWPCTVPGSRGRGRGWGPVRARTREPDCADPKCFQAPSLTPGSQLSKPASTCPGCPHPTTLCLHLGLPFLTRVLPSCPLHTAPAPWPPSREPVTSLAGPSCPNSQGGRVCVSGLWLPGDQKNRIHHLAALFPCLLFFLPKNGASSSLPPSGRASDMPGHRQRCPLLLGGKNGTINNNKKKKSLGFMEALDL
ncbi:WAS/WASL-interacting protein family member 3-like [Marmota flaviventris]|uniref:WAS/WASL-interacting protein family member 3-like n=1 Tax=Marmota flaviventris TaxID=93162 RepID=UPI003A83EC90